MATEMSIRTRLLLIVLLATAFPVLLVLARFLQERDAAMATDTAGLAAIAHNRATLLNEKIQATAQLLYGLARARDLATDDRAACSQFLSDVREAYPQFTGILTVRPDGRLFCDSLRSGRELDLRDRAYFKAALASRNAVTLEPAFGRLTGQAVMQVAYPVRAASGELQFVLLASLRLSPLVQLEQGLGTPGARLMLVDRKGLLLAATPDGGAGPSGGTTVDPPLLQFAAGQASAATAVLAGSQGRPVVWALAEPGLTRAAGLHLLAGAARDELTAVANRRFAQDMALLGLATVLLFGAVWLLAELAVRRQVARITRMTRQLAEGDLTARLAPPLPRGELGAVMNALNHSAESLQTQRADIERLNSRLQQSQRLEAVGQLTGGVAHDFNNLLTVVLGNAELLAEQATDRPQQRQLAETIAAAAQRGAVLTRQLLAFARRQTLDPRAIDVNQLLAALDPMLRRTLGEHIEIETIRGAGLWLALVDAGQLDNAILNLCLNARDAMPSGGRLTLETANAALDAAYAERYPDVAPGQYVMLAVSDTGHGIAPEHLKQVFEPFFTTKPKGKGTGLGLAMVYGFIKQSAGHVSIYSEAGHGTTVKLYLPRAPVGASPAAPAPPAQVPVEGGSERVLVVEDDELVREHACRELRALGYEVLAADGGKAALALIEQHADIALLFTDVVMPGMSGRSLADAARAMRPGLRVLYTSGYTENAIVHHGRLDSGVKLLPKPYRRAELARAVRGALTT
jgi:signal transduction histidine kinase/CheY-like chemotaxis protein